MKFTAKFISSDIKNTSYISKSSYKDKLWVGQNDKSSILKLSLVEIRKILYEVIRYHKAMDRDYIMTYSIDMEKE